MCANRVQESQGPRWAMQLKLSIQLTKSLPNLFNKTYLTVTDGDHIAKPTKILELLIAAPAPVRRLFPLYGHSPIGRS